jgi:hypothetical protein
MEYLIRFSHYLEPRWSGAELRRRGEVDHLLGGSLWQ